MRENVNESIQELLNNDLINEVIEYILNVDGDIQRIVECKNRYKLLIEFLINYFWTININFVLICNSNLTISKERGAVLEYY